MKQLLIGVLCLITYWQADAQANFHKKWQTQFILAQNGDTLTLPAGTFYLKKSLSLEGKKNVTIRGAGMGKTVLNFKNQVDGAEGIYISNGVNIIVEDLTIQEAKGDAIKAIRVKGITLRRVETEWVGKRQGIQGAYGLYPVLCQQVLIEHCQARGACDAGIYVGQSRDIVVRYCEVEYNTSGINVENSVRADVYHNLSMHNAVGILVCSVPLLMNNGGHARVFSNKVYYNNHKNFGPWGEIVTKMPSGTGIMVVSNPQVEIFNNEIVGNRTMGTGVMSFSTVDSSKFDAAYFDQYPHRVSIHHNVYQGSVLGTMFSKNLASLNFGKMQAPHILFDGVVDPTKPMQQTLCIRGNQVQDQYPLFANINAAQGFKNIRYNIDAYNCSLPKLEQAGVGFK
ncbi:parallel beta-helix domain-containing protein [uncultured Microscilla sp.]|uniref:parallel beta-helix domain-containing protein n=1 Tax=uncultured Microscilla sp. TaxID=432653 RepID=UPI0026393397|nr:parallel beta-helix domain-containing protein [uncultured Microscilla sp.]